MAINSKKNSPLAKNACAPNHAKSPFVTAEKATARLQELEIACDAGDLDQLRVAVELLAVSHAQAPVWLCKALLTIINEQRGNRKTGRRGVLSTEAGVLTRNQDDFERYLIVRKLIREREQSKQKVSMKQVYSEALVYLLAMKKICTARTVQDAYLRILRTIRIGQFHPERYMPDNPELALELVGETVPN